MLGLLAVDLYTYVESVSEPIMERARALRLATRADLVHYALDAVLLTAEERAAAGRLSVVLRVGVQWARRCGWFDRGSTLGAWLRRGREMRIQLCPSAVRRCGTR